MFATFRIVESSFVGGSRGEFPGASSSAFQDNLSGKHFCCSTTPGAPLLLHPVLNYQITEAAGLLEADENGCEDRLFDEVLVVSLRTLIGSASLGTRRVSLPRLGRSLIWVAVLAASSLGIRANAQSADSRLPGDVSPRHQSEDSKVIVVGLLGGFVPSNDSHHPEVQLVRELQQQYPAGAYFRVFENHKINDAYRAILQQLELDQTEFSQGQNTQHVRVVLFGHSWGASAVVRLARKLERQGV